MADTTVKIFDSTMIGAPSLPNNTAGSLIAVLDACLKDGFGLKSVDSIVVASGVATVNISTGHSAKTDVVMLIAGSGTSALNGEKRVVAVSSASSFTFDATGVADGTYTGSVTCKVAPAGWLKPFSSGNIAAYKSPNPQSCGMIYRIDDSDLSDSRIFGCESMVGDIDTYTGRFPLNTQISDGGLSIPRFSGVGNAAWWIIANDRTVYIGIAFYSPTPNDYTIYGFGDFKSRKVGDPYASFVSAQTFNMLGYSAEPTISSLFVNQGGASSAIYCPRPHTGIGTATPLQGKYNTIAISQASGTSWLPFPNPGDNSLLFDEMLLQEYQSIYALRGSLPGVLASLHQTNGQISDGTVLPPLVGYPGKKFLWKILGSSSVSSRGGFAIDVSGPWGY